MLFLDIYPYAVLGIAISVILPILKKSLIKSQSKQEDAKKTLKEIARPYLIIGAISMCVGLLVVAFSGDTLKDWSTALMAGFTWDSILQKVGS